MKNLQLLFISAVLIAMTGCNEQNKIKQTDKQTVFPPQLVGVWVAEKDFGVPQWGFKFEADGTISKFRHIIADYVDNNGKPVYLEGKDPNSYAEFVFGPVEADFDPKSKTLSVKVILKHYIMKMPAGQLQGHSDDYLSGTISPDWNTWNAQWIGYGWLDGATPPDVNNPNPIAVKFKKLSGKELKRYQTSKNK